MKIISSFDVGPIQGYKFGTWPFGRPKLFSHMYFIDGLLVDTGHPHVKKDVGTIAASLPIEQIVITHHHEDHSGNIEIVKELNKVPAFASAKCIDLLKNPPKVSFAQYLNWGQNKSYQELAPIGSEVNTKQFSFQVIDVPGHAVDMIALYEANEGWLFSADLYVHYYIRYFKRDESFWGQIESIRKVLALDFDILLCGHSPQLGGGKEKLKQKLQFLEDFYGQVVHHYHQGKSVKEIFQAMSLKEDWGVRLLSGGELSVSNMLNAAIQDEVAKNKN